MQKTLAKSKGVVRAVFSGDSLVLHKAGKDGFSENVYLANIQAPRLGNPSKVEDSFAFDAREAVREKIIGKKVDFILEYSHSNRKYVTLFLEDENINLMLVKAGLAKLVEKRGDQHVTDYEALQAAQEDCKKRKIGVWNEDTKHHQKHTREVVYAGEPDFNAKKLFDSVASEEKPLAAILEHVFSPTFVSLYVYKMKAVVKLSMVHLFSTKDADKDIIAEGKTFVEKMLLHKTVGVKLSRVDENGTMVGRILFPAGDIACEVLKQGFCRISTPKDMNFDADYFRELKQAQLIGQSKRAGIWQNLQAEDLNPNKSGIQDFVGKVVEVHSGDSLTVERDNSTEQIRVFLASIKAPSMARSRAAEKAVAGEPDNDPYAWESKESLRKLAIGKRVKVEMEYSRSVPSSKGNDMQMNFATVSLQKNDLNLGVKQLEKGLCRTSVNKSGENVSKYLEDLLAAEKKATESKVCLHNKNAPPYVVFQDLINNQKQAKEYEQMVFKRADKKFNGVVEHVFSGMRFKVRLETEGRIIALSLLGVKTPSNDKNQPQLLEASNEALAFAKAQLFQRDVQVELYFADKRGNFFGTLVMPNKEDFSIKLLEKGLASIQIEGTS